MPVLTVDLSKGAASALLINENLSYKIVRLPIVFPDIHYAHKKTYNEIFRYFLAMVEEEFKTKIVGEMDIYVSTISELGISGNRIHPSLKDDAFKALKGFDFMYFGHQHVGSSLGIFHGDLDYKEVLRELYLDEKETTLINYFENFILYPFVRPSSDRDFYEEEAYLKVIARRNCKVLSVEKFPSDKTINFSTTRPLPDELSMCRFMLLCIESLCQPGIFNMRLDEHNFLGAIAALALLNKKFFSSIELPEFLSLGQVVNHPEPLSLEIVEMGGAVTSLELGKNDLFTYPLSEGKSVKLTIKSGLVGTLEKQLRGGVFGIVVDTRDKNNKPPLLPEDRKKYIKHWEVTLLQNLKGL